MTQIGKPPEFVKFSDLELVPGDIILYNNVYYKEVWLILSVDKMLRLDIKLKYTSRPEHHIGRRESFLMIRNPKWQ